MIASAIVGAALLGVVVALIAVPLTASAEIVVRELTAERRAALAMAHAATAPAGGARASRELDVARGAAAAAVLARAP